MSEMTTAAATSVTDLFCDDSNLREAFKTLRTEMEEVIFQELVRFKVEEEEAIRDGHYHQADFSTSGLFEDIMIGLRSKLRQSRIMQQTFEAYDQAAVA